ncbi:MAG: Monomeric sarcosine oxidase [Chloroflexota bacterium]
MGGRPDLLVVGGGVWGTWTALQARRLGASVRLVEERTPGDPKTTSGDYSRIIRHAHGEDGLLVGWAQRSLAAWRELGERTGRQVFVESGVAWFVSGDGAWEAASEVQLRAAGVPCERLAPDEALRRWPALGTEGLKSVLYEPTAGFLRAGDGVRAAAAVLRDEGGEIVRGRATPAADGTALDEHGAPIVAGATVWAAGPWLPALFPALVGADCEAAIVPVRRDAIYFDAPGMGVGEVPTWIDEGLEVWGIPDDEGHGAKVGPEFDAGSFDPGAWPDEAHPSSVARARACAVRFPRLQRAPIRETRACQHERTKSGHYVLDRHPTNPQVWIAGGGSGHGYKQGPAVGELMARAALDRTPIVLPDRRFALARRDGGPSSPMGEMGAA